jgi:hypothetical protein
MVDRSLSSVSHRITVSSESELVDDDYQSNFEGPHLPNQLELGHAIVYKVVELHKIINFDNWGSS